MDLFFRAWSNAFTRLGELFEYAANHPIDAMTSTVSWLCGGVAFVLFICAFGGVFSFGGGFIVSLKRKIFDHPSEYSEYKKGDVRSSAIGFVICCTYLALHFFVSSLISPPSEVTTIGVLAENLNEDLNNFAETMVILFSVMIPLMIFSLWSIKKSNTKRLA